MLRTLFASFCFLQGSALGCHAQSADPFALLFGDETNAPDVGRSDTPGRDDIALVRVQLGDFTLIETQPVYQTQSGICFPASDLFEALEFPIETSAQGASGWFIDPARALTVDAGTRTAELSGRAWEIDVQPIENGWCLPLSDWSEILPIDFEYRSGTLSVELSPREILPIEARLEREALRRQIQVNSLIDPDYPELEDPYRWLSFPTADIDLDLQIAPDNKGAAQGTLLLAGDILKMTGQLQYLGTDRPRINLGRVSETANNLGPLKARSFAFGDVVSVDLPLLQQAQTGQGFVISNRPTVSADIFDTTDIRGPLPKGWEAELYDGGQLLGFVSEADLNGDYVFSDVALRPGYNRFTVKLFGPYGERDERIVKIMVGAELCPENELQYSVGVVRRDALDDADAETKPTAYASLRYGLTARTSAQVDAVLSQEESVPALGASLSSTVFGTYGVARIASDGTGTPALAASAQKRLNDRGARLLFDVRDFGSLATDISGHDEVRIQRSALLRFDTPVNFGFGRHPMAMQSRLEWTRRQDQSEDVHASARLSGSLGLTRWKKALRYSNYSNESGARSVDLNGDVLINRSFRDWRLRGAATYSANQHLSLETLAFAGQKRFGQRDFGQLSLGYDMASSDYNLNTSYARTFKTFVLSANGSIDSQGNVSAGLRISFSLFNDRKRGRYALAAPGLSRTGAVRAFVFDDIDDDGTYGAEDAAIPNAEFILDQSLRREQTDSHGFAVLADVQPGDAANLELKQSSIEDPFLRPVQTGLSITPRPGRVIDAAFPLTATADIDGVVLIRKGDYDTPVSGVLIEAVSESGDVVGTTRTEYDGYFYVDNIPARNIHLRVAESDLRSVGATSEPVQVNLSREAPSAMGLTLFILQP